jgi:hypothetical protein
MVISTTLFIINLPDFFVVNNEIGKINKKQSGVILLQIFRLYMYPEYLCLGLGATGTSA